MLLRETCAEGAANTDAVSLFKNGGPWRDADAEDIETFKRHGLIAPNTNDVPMPTGHGASNGNNLSKTNT